MHAHSYSSQVIPQAYTPGTAATIHAIAARRNSQHSLQVLSSLCLSLSQPGREVGQTLDRSHIADSDGHGPGLTNHHDEPLASGHSGIEQIPGEHRIVLRGQGYHHHWIFRALAFMHGGRIGQGYFIQFSDVIADDAPVKVDLNLAGLDIDL